MGGKIKLTFEEIILEIKEIRFKSLSQTQSKYTKDYHNLKNMDLLAEDLLLSTKQS